MKHAQKPDHVSLTTLVGRLREGRYVIPDFQREFEWQPSDILALMRSVFLDYYIGSLLIWKGKPDTFEALACEPLSGFTATNGRTERTHIVLDGQQRLSAMYYAFMAPDRPAPSRRKRFLYFIRVDRFMDEMYDEAFECDWRQRSLHRLTDQVAQFESHRFPLAVVGEGGWSLGNWVQGYEKHWQSKESEARKVGDDVAAKLAGRHAENARAFGEHLRAITEEYQVVYIELDQDLELDRVCDIFTQINSRGVRLDIFDLINALLKPKGIQLKHMWRDAGPKLAFVRTERMNVYVLQVMSILRQDYCSPKYLYYLLPDQQKKVRDADGSFRTEVLVEDVSKFKDGWNEAVEALESAITLLRQPQQLGAISSRYLPYPSILPALAAARAFVRRNVAADRQLGAFRKVDRWYWASVFTERYSGSVDSTSTRDYGDLKRWFGNDDAEPELISAFKDRLRNLDLRKRLKRGTAVYNGIFNLLVIHGAKDWITGDAPTFESLDDHHIVPKSWGQSRELNTSVDTILNRTPLTADTNRKVIKDRLPNEYIPKLIESSGESTVREVLESHFISPSALDLLLRDPFTPDDFEGFVSERQRTILEAIEDLLVKERLDLSPRLRELDAQVERIELDLRAYLVGTLAGDESRLPPHVRQRIDQRVKAARNRNPGANPERYNTLQGKIEYSDLRELEDVLVNKTLHPVFATTFPSKELLGKRFDQLAQLRNGIRHSRTVDEITRKEGEAAILWFRQALGGNGCERLGTTV